MKTLLTVSAAVELSAGAGLVTTPSTAATLLTNSSSGAPSELIVARVAGMALFALGVACWRARGDARASKAVVPAMLVYNGGAAAVLSWAGAVLGLSGLAIWSAALLHVVMTAWCVKVMARPGVAPSAAT